MKTVRESTTLYNFLGSHNPYWRLTESSDVLRFSTTETTEPDRTLQLSAEQAARIREMTVITSSLMMSLTVDESDLSVHLVGRKINKREWAGNASAWHDTPAVARDLSHGLSFA
ncbi:cyclic di-GMP phosphodiesterase, partial [Escherichia coli]|nr:cyclic di-GMP phosphodiesterase [Escherichia coli]